MSTKDENPIPSPKFNVVAAPPNTVENLLKKPAPITRKKKQNDAKEELEVGDGYTALKNRRCCVSTCMNGYKKCQLFTFPNDKRLYQWKELTGVAKGRHRKNLFICAEHFEESDFIMEKEKIALSNTAIPSNKLHIVHPTITEPMGMEAISCLSDTALKLDDTIKEIEYYKIYKGCTFKDLQLNFYIEYPNAYKLLVKPFNLMEPLVLKRTLAKLKNVHKIVAKKLAVMSPKQKICILSQGKISMTPKIYYDHKFDKLIGFIDSEFDLTLPHVAETAKFLVLSGIYENWNIPLDISYSDYHEKNRRSMKNWLGGIGEVLGILFKDIVKVLVVLPEVDIIKSKPQYIRPFQNQLIESFNFDQNIIVLYDLQFLLKALFYGLTNWYYLIPGPTKLEIVKLSHFSKLKTVDSKSKCSLVPYLMIPQGSFEELKFETFLEIFSKNTVTALQTYIKLELIPEEVEGTLIFIAKISSLLDIFKGEIPDKRQIISILSDLESMFSKLIVSEYESNINIDPKHTAVDYLIKTLQTLKTLYVKDSELFTAVSKKLLKNYTNDFCEKINIKSRGQPTIKIVNETFKRLSIDNLLKPLNQGKVNFNDAIDLFIEHLRAVIPNTIFTNTTIDLEFKPADYKIYFSERPDKLIYISGYLLKKCSEKHSCEVFNKYLVNTNNYTISSLMLDVANGDCLIPKVDFINYVELLEMVFLSYFPKVLYRVGIIKALVEVLGQVGFKVPCLCFPLLYMIQLFVCIRIEHLVRCSNLELKLGKRLNLEPISIVGS